MHRTLSTYRIWTPVEDELASEFLEAICLSDLDTIEWCISEGTDPNITDDDNLTALHHAAVRGDLKLAAILFKAPAIDLDKTDEQGYTALMLACRYGNEEIVKELLKQGADPDLKNDKQQTALHMACTQNSLKSTRHLVGYGAKLNVRDTFDNSPISIAAIDRGSIAITVCLLRNGANATRTKKFPLFLECVLNCNTKERLKIIKILLYYGVDIYCTHPVSKKNCLHYVAITAYHPAAKVLVKRGQANLYGRDLAGRTPLDVAWDHKNMTTYNYYMEWTEKHDLRASLEDDILQSLYRLFESFK